MSTTNAKIDRDALASAYRWGRRCRHSLGWFRWLSSRGRPTADVAAETARLEAIYAATCARLSGLLEETEDNTP